MKRVTLLYDRDCPNVEAARANLQAAFARLGVLPRWDEMDQSSPDAPAEWRGYGSPTVLIDGRDAAGRAPEGQSASCRIYIHDGKRANAPPVDLLVDALRSTPLVQEAPANARTNC